jgi:hypothetical protein
MEKRTLSKTVYTISGKTQRGFPQKFDRTNPSVDKREKIK